MSHNTGPEPHCWRLKQNVPSSSLAPELPIDYRFSLWWGKGVREVWSCVVQSDGGGDAGWQQARLKLKIFRPWNEKRPTGPIKWLLLSGRTHMPCSTLHPVTHTHKRKHTPFTKAPSAVWADGAFVCKRYFLVQLTGGLMALCMGEGTTLTVMTLSLALFC